MNRIAFLIEKEFKQIFRNTILLRIMIHDADHAIDPVVIRRQF
jgi:hypothetical protein